jgi:hypothetical protein
MQVSIYNVMLIIRLYNIVTDTEICIFELCNFIISITFKSPAI